MRLAELLKRDNADRLELTQQQQEELQLEFDRKIMPKKGHSLFEVNLSTGTIELAQFSPVSEEIHWNDAVLLYKSRQTRRFSAADVGQVTKSKLSRSMDVSIFLG